MSWATAVCISGLPRCDWARAMAGMMPGLQAARVLLPSEEHMLRGARGWWLMMVVGGGGWLVVVGLAELWQHWGCFARVLGRGERGLVRWRSGATEEI